MRAAPGLIALVMLAACEGGGDPVEQALRDTAAANHSAVTQVTAEAVEPRAARSTDQDRVDAMLAEHRASRAKAEAILRDTRDPELRRLAQATAESRTREIAELEAWRPADQSAVVR